MSPLLLLALACGAGEALVPAGGHWTVDDEQIDSDPCGLTQGGGGSGMPTGFTIVEPDQAGFSLVVDDDTEQQACTLDGAGFSCAPYDETESGSSGAGGYTLTYTWQSGGTLLEERSLELAIDLDIACDGAMCGDIEDSYELEFPCAIAATLGATAD